MLIAERFRGPPDSGNGGYACGLLAGLLDGDADVSLRVPPPLRRELTAERDGERALLLDGETLVAEAWPTRIVLDPPAAIPSETAAEASAESLFASDERDFFRSCFVCGPDRDEGDGLRIFPGAVPGRDLFAATWTPDADLAGGDGTVRPEIVWAALDCPTSAPGANWDGGPPIVLARLAAHIEHPVAAEEPHTILSWPLEIDGRKRRAGAAVYDASGRALAWAQALWIELKAG